MDLNQSLPEESLSLNTTHNSEMGSAHPASNNEDSEARNRENEETPGVMPGWLAQLVNKASNNNSHRALEQFQKMKPPVFEGKVDPLQAEAWLLQIEKILEVMSLSLIHI